MSNIGPLTAAFTPQPSCSSYTGYTQSWVGTFGFFFAQGPLITAGCFPKDYDPANTRYYSPGVCPSGYTVACSSLNSVGSETEVVKTCCPSASVGSFSCQGPPHAPWPWESTLGCVQQVTSTTRTLGPLTIVESGKTSTTGSITISDGAVAALAVVVRSQLRDEAKSTGPPTTAAPSTGRGAPTTGVPIATSDNSGSSSGNSGGGLSSGAAAGVGVGATLALLLLGVGAFLLWRRKKKNSNSNSGPAELPEEFLYNNNASPGAGPGTNAGANAGWYGPKNGPSPQYNTESSTTHTTPTQFHVTAPTPTVAQDKPPAMTQRFELPTEGAHELS